VQAGSGDDPLLQPLPTAKRAKLHSKRATGAADAVLQGQDAPAEGAAARESAGEGGSGTWGGFGMVETRVWEGARGLGRGCGEALPSGARGAPVAGHARGVGSVKAKAEDSGRVGGPAERARQGAGAASGDGGGVEEARLARGSGQSVNAVGDAAAVSEAPRGVGVGQALLIGGLRPQLGVGAGSRGNGDGLVVRGDDGQKGGQRDFKIRTRPKFA
jgi:hypothetical protein